MQHGPQPERQKQKNRVDKGGGKTLPIKGFVMGTPQQKCLGIDANGVISAEKSGPLAVSSKSLSRIRRQTIKTLSEEPKPVHRQQTYIQDKKEQCFQAGARNHPKWKIRHREEDRAASQSACGKPK